MSGQRERYYRDFHGADAESHPYSNSGGYADFMESEDILKEMFGRGGGEARFRMRGTGCPLPACRSNSWRR